MAVAIEPEVRLSPRERDVLRAMCTGKGVKQIAHSLHISTYTVSNYRMRIFFKLRVNDAGSAVWLAARNDSLLSDGHAHIRHRVGCRCKACGPLREE